MIIHDECLNALKKLDDNSVDQLVTDPPYGIEFMSKDWDKAIPSIDIWKEVYRVMKPGSFGFILCIPRQDCLSRMMISLEDAGFNINFSSIYWTYASGFPKALNMGKAIDKRLGKEREVVGVVDDRQAGFGQANHQWDKNSSVDYKKTITKGNSPLEGSYGGFQPKPAVEVVIVVMKPLSEKSYIDQAMKDGKGVTWFDDCRIPYQDSEDVDFKKEFNNTSGNYFSGDNITPNNDKTKKEYKEGGRFPANLLISDDILGRDKITSSVGGFDHYQEEGKNIYDGNVFHKSKTKLTEKQGKMGDVGTFSRFFSLDAWSERNLPFLIVPKASKKEKNLGCEGLFETVKNNHPTVKPMKLISYLITMGSRPGDVIIDPFAGSGTTGCAAIMLNRKYILIEKEEEYIEIIKSRIKYFRNQPLKF